MRTSLLAEDLPGHALIRVLAAAALTASAAAGAALALALAAPGIAHAETPGLSGQRSFTLPAGTPARFGPSLAVEEPANLTARLATSAATPATARRAALPAFRLEADEAGLSTVYHVHDYDLRLEYGTVFYRTVAVPGQPADSLLRGRLTGRVVTRF